MNRNILYNYNVDVEADVNIENVTVTGVVGNTMYATELKNESKPRYVKMYVVTLHIANIQKLMGFTLIILIIVNKLNLTLN